MSESHPNTADDGQEQVTDAAQHFADHVQGIVDGKTPFDSLYTSAIASFIVAEQSSLATAGLVQGGYSALTSAVTVGGIGVSAAAFCAARYFKGRQLMQAANIEVQKENNARYELLRIKKAAGHETLPYDGKKKRFAAEMIYHGTFDAQSVSALQDVARMMELAKINKVARVYMPAVLASALEIDNADFKETTVHERIRKDVRLAKRTKVADAALKHATPEEWLETIEKADTGLNIESVLSAIERVSPADPLVRIWKSYMALPQAEDTRAQLHQTLYKQLKVGFERQMHDSETDGTEVRRVLVHGETPRNGRFVSHIHGEVCKGQVRWRDQYGVETKTTSLKTALELQSLDDATIAKMLSDKSEQPATPAIKAVAEYTLFRLLHKRLHNTSQDIALTAELEPIAVADHHNGVLVPLAENIKTTKEMRRGKYLAARIGAAILGASSIAVPAALTALAPEGVATTQATSSELSGAVTGIDEGGGENTKVWDVDEHGVEAKGYWAYSTSNKLAVQSDSWGDPNISWMPNDYKDGPRTRLPTTLSKNVASMKVERDIVPGEVREEEDISETDSDGWAIRIPVRAGTDIAAANYDGKPLAFDYQPDGTIWLHGDTEMADDPKPLKYWLTPSEHPPVVNALDDISIGSTYEEDDLFPAAEIEKLLPRKYAEPYRPESFASYTRSKWRYDLDPFNIDELDGDKPLRAFIHKALTVKRANCNIANTLQALYDVKDVRSTVNGYSVDNDEDGLYSHSAHMWTVNQSGKILDATPRRAAGEYEEYFSTPKLPFWNEERIAQAATWGAIGATSIAGGIVLGRPYFWRRRYEYLIAKSQGMHKKIDDQRARRAASVIDQLLFAPNFNLSQAELQAKTSMRNGSFFTAKTAENIISEKTEDLLEKKREAAVNQKEHAMLTEAIRTVRQARKLVNRQNKAAAKAAALRPRIK